MWCLVLVCVMTVGGGVPTHPTKEATSHAPDNGTVTSMLGVSKSSTTGALKVSVVPSNNTNVTTGSPAIGVVAVMPGPQQHSAETLEELQGDVAVHEGDILMSVDRNAVTSVWPDAIVPYAISNELASQESNILNAFKMISKVTCIRFIQHTTESNSVLFKSGNGCASYVGCQGGVQTLYYDKTCSLGNLCHELIHALGLHHEHTRKDRDQYISVQWESIIPGKESNFMVKNGDTLNLPYDLESIMHYGQHYFSVNGSPTVLAKQENSVIGQRTHLSKLDILKINKLYHCDGGER